MEERQDLKEMILFNGEADFPASLEAVYEVEALGGYALIDKKVDFQGNEEFRLGYAPTSADKPDAFYIEEANPIGYMGDNPNPFDTFEEAKACLRGMDFEANLQGGRNE